jgi:hypothetical protein
MLLSSWSIHSFCCASPHHWRIIQLVGISILPADLDLAGDDVSHRSIGNVASHAADAIGETGETTALGHRKPVQRIEDA